MGFNSVVVVIGLLATLTVVAQAQRFNTPPVPSNQKVVCIYNSTSLLREGLGKLVVSDLEQALPFCTHLIYGYAGIDVATNKLKSLNENLDLDSGNRHYRVITQLKAKYPQLRVLLGVGGNADPQQDIYLEMLESSTARITFINSAYSLIKNYNFDGLDLAWQFKPNKPQRIRSSIGSAWYSFKKVIGAAGKALDEKAAEHKEGFTALVRELKNAFRIDNYLLSVTVLPNVNTTIFIDVPNIINNVDFVQLAAFDFQTWNRNPYEADYPAPTYAPLDRVPESNIDYQVNLWIQNQAPRNKLVVGIPTHGRTWELTTDSTKTGVPPIKDIELPGPEGIQTKTPGLLSWPEVCAKLPNPSNAQLRGELQPLRKVGDPAKRFGNYAYRLPDSDGHYGLWVGYEDPETAQAKAEYVARQNLGGVAIYDLSNDDFRGTCAGEKYPILRAAKYKLSVP